MLRKLIKEQCGKYLEGIAQSEDDEVAKVILNDYYKFLYRNDLFFLMCATGHERIAKWKALYQPFCDKVSLMTWKVVQMEMHPPSEGMIPLKGNFSLQRLFLCYRAFYKTTIVTIGHSCQLLLNFPNIHIVLCHNTQGISSKNLVAVKNLFLNKPHLSTDIKELIFKEYGIRNVPSILDVFPECIPPTKEWGSTEKFSLANRTDFQRPESSIEAKGVDTEITGGHWQVAKKNDLVTEKSVNTDDQIQKSFDWDSLFNKGHFDDPKDTLQDYEGTRYHAYDLYSIKKGDPKMELIEKPIVHDLEKFLQGDDSQILHKDRFNRDDVLSMMGDMWTFMCQMMLKPEDPAKKQFRIEMIQYFTEIVSGMNYYLLIDPASSRKKKSDFTVMLVIGVIKDGVKTIKYVVDGIRDKIDPKKRVDTALQLAMQWNVKGIGWESIGFQDTDIYYFEEERRKKRFYITPEEIKSHKVSKEDRIRALVPEYASQEWFWPEKGKLVKNSEFDGKSYDITEELEHELVNFPMSQHDDLMDAMSFLNRINFNAPESKEKPQDRNYTTFGDYTKSIDEKNNILPSDNIVIGKYT